MFVTFEGPEGAGKTTQSERLAAVLRGLGREVVTTREPGGTRLGEQVRSLVLHGGDAPSARAEACLFAAARAQLVSEVIEPALARGAAVICDRFADSSLAYQSGGRGIPREEIERLIAFATEGRAPDLTFLLDLDVEGGLARKAGRTAAPTDRLESEELSFHRRVRDAYHWLAAREPDRIIVLDATLPPDVLAARILEVVLRGVGT